MFSVLKEFFGRKVPVGVPVYQGFEHSLEETRIYLKKYSGGNVDLKLDDKTGIATICLNHTQKKNSITGKMMVDLESAIAQLESWGIGKGILVFGAENNFCSGGDLNFVQQTCTAADGHRMATFMQQVLHRLQGLPMISVAFIEGLALGGGAELAISCDFRVFSSKDSGMGFVHSKMGIIPAWGGMTTAMETLGYRTALDLVTTGRVVRGAEAEHLGLCDALVEDLSAAEAWLALRTAADSSVVRAAKSVAQFTRSTTSGARGYEKIVFSPLWGGPAHKQALSQKIKHK